MPKTQPSKRGGFRSGSGRKLPPGASGPKVRFTVRLRPEVAEWVKANGGSLFAESILTAARASEVQP